MAEKGIQATPKARDIIEAGSNVPNLGAKITNFRTRDIISFKTDGIRIGNGKHKEGVKTIDVSNIGAVHNRIHVKVGIETDSNSRRRLADFLTVKVSHTIASEVRLRNVLLLQGVETVGRNGGVVSGDRTL